MKRRVPVGHDSNQECWYGKIDGQKHNLGCGESFEIPQALS